MASVLASPRKRIVPEADRRCCSLRPCRNAECSKGATSAPPMPSGRTVRARTCNSSRSSLPAESERVACRCYLPFCVNLRDHYLHASSDDDNGEGTFRLRPNLSLSFLPACAPPLHHRLL